MSIKSIYVQLLIHHQKVLQILCVDVGQRPVDAAEAAQAARKQQELSQTKGSSKLFSF